MSDSKSPHHNSKPITKKTFLPPLQKKVLLYLANNEPKTINETVKALKSHYKSTWNAFNNLEKKTLINPVSTKKYQGQEYPAIGQPQTELLLLYATALRHPM
jgi:ribosomal protein L28